MIFAVAIEMSLLCLFIFTPGLQEVSVDSTHFEGPRHPNPSSHNLALPPLHWHSDSCVQRGEKVPFTQEAVGVVHSPSQVVVAVLFVAKGGINSVSFPLSDVSWSCAGRRAGAQSFQIFAEVLRYAMDCEGHSVSPRHQQTENQLPQLVLSPVVNY